MVKEEIGEINKLKEEKQLKCHSGNVTMVHERMTGNFSGEDSSEGQKKKKKKECVACD